MSATSKTWTKTSQLSDQALGITDLAYVNGTYLAYSKNHPETVFGFQKAIISSDLDSWQHRNNILAFPFQVSDVFLYSAPKNFIAVASKLTADGKKLIVLTSPNGFEWDIQFETEDVSEKYTPTSINFFDGLYMVTCTGCIFVSVDDTTWKKISLPESFAAAKIINAAHGFNGTYLLAKLNGVSYIVFTKDGIEFSITKTPWQMESVNISGNGSQILVSIRIKNRACVIYFSDDIEAYGILSIPENPHGETFLTISSMAWANNEWFLSCNREFLNSSSIKFSVASYMFRTIGNITEDSELIRDEISSLNLNNIKLVNGSVIAFGESFPHPENCLYKVE